MNERYQWRIVHMQTTLWKKNEIVVNIWSGNIKQTIQNKAKVIWTEKIQNVVFWEGEYVRLFAQTFERTSLEIMHVSNTSRMSWLNYNMVFNLLIDFQSEKECTTTLNALRSVDETWNEKEMNLARHKYNRMYRLIMLSISRTNEIFKIPTNSKRRRETINHWLKR